MNDNVLSKIPGELLGSNRNRLPDAATCAEDSQRVSVRLLDGARYEVAYISFLSDKQQRDPKLPVGL